MTDKKEAGRTTGICDYLTRHDMKSMSVEELEELRSVSVSASDGIMTGLKVMGALAFWACDNENYSGIMAKDNLRGISESLMYLLGIVEALNLNADNAQMEIYRRNGLPVNEGAV